MIGAAKRTNNVYKRLLAAGYEESQIPRWFWRSDAPPAPKTAKTAETAPPGAEGAENAENASDAPIAVPDPLGSPGGPQKRSAAERRDLSGLSEEERAGAGFIRHGAELMKVYVTNLCML